MNWLHLVITICSASAIFSLFLIAALIVSGRISRAEEAHETIDMSGDRM